MDKATSKKIKKAIEKLSFSFPAVYAVKNDEGQVLIADSGHRLIDREDAEMTINLMQKYLAHIKDVDVYAYNANLLTVRNQRQQKIWGKGNRPVSKTNIYLLHNPINNFYKIGRSKSLERRVKTLTSEEVDLIMVHSFVGTNKDETTLHTKFKNKRIRGEWFALDAKDIEFITTYKSSQP